MVDIRVEKVPERPGYARIVISPLAAPATAPGIIIRREGYQEQNLGYRGWQVREEELVPAEVAGTATGMTLLLGPQVTRHLESAPYLLKIPSLRVLQHVFWPDDIDIFDGDLPPARDYAREPDAARPDPSPVSPPGGENRERTIVVSRGDPAAERAFAPPEPPRPPERVDLPGSKPRPTPNRRPIYIVAGLLSLLVVAGAVAWFVFVERPEQQAAAPSPPPPPLAPAPSSPAAPPADTARPPATPGWPEGTDSFTPVEIVQRAPNAEAILAVAQRRLQAGRYEDALVLFEQAAERGVAAASTALARMYDPNGFEPGKPFRNPDGRTAASYYKEGATRGDGSAAAAREALRQRLEKEAGQGNGTAATALKDFWP